MNLHLISFCSPEKNYDSTRNRFHNEALSLGVFKSINLFSERNCFSYCDDLSEHKKFMESTRAYGFWIWKFFLISKLMKSIPENDVICYADIGCTFNIEGKLRLGEYYSMTMDNGSLCFCMDHLKESEYTKSDTYFKIFPNDETYLNTGQRCSTTYFLKNTKENRFIIDECKLISTENNYHCIDDSESSIPNHKTFKGEHRFDQSIFSLISKKYNFYCISDETYWHPNWNNDGKEYPIWATRIR
jgi:hypothetical protein